MTSSSPAEKGYVCLTDVFSFVRDYAAGRYCSGFSDNTAYGLLQRRSAFCSDICDVEIVGIDTWNYLDKVKLMFNNFSHNKSVCSGWTYRNVQLTVDCSSWEREQYFIHDSCVKSNAQCSKWQELCVCHCNVDYVMVAGNCAKGGLTIGEPCVVNEQCTGGVHHGLCRGRVCTCQEGYVKRYTTCYQGGLTIGETCVVNEQCTGGGQTGLCRGRVCTCQEGYITVHTTCYQGGLTIGETCVFNEQCTGGGQTGLCRGRVCTCQEGYITVHTTCYQGGLTIGETCVVNEQCTGGGQTGLCRGRVCTCQEGYITVHTTCYQGGLMIGDPCVANEQCTGGGQPGLCRGHECTCQEGYITRDSRCYQGNVSVGGHCFLNEQCNGSPNTVMCSNDQKCLCTSGYIAIQQHCLKVNIPLNMSCHNNEQCSHTSHALCLQRKCGCTEGFFAYNSTECLQDNVHVGEPCVDDQQCRGTAMSGICKNSTCICAKGYFSQGQNCYKGNVSLGDACILYPQCLGSPNASCLDGICSCIEGYVPDNSSKCIQSFPVNDNEASFGDQRESNINVGSTVGALIGGVLLGVLITTVIGFIINKRSGKNPNTRQREEPRVVFADNDAYGEAKIDRNVGNASRGNKNKRKVVNVPPYAPSDETPEYGNVSQTSGTRTEDIYNHLNEKEDRDGEDDYDHACVATGLSRGGYFDSDYSSMRDVDNGCSKSAKNVNDNYFTLEQN
ncbi:uncharacterized protein LOC111109898 isoform X1 [Crassostrea virginica]